MTIKQGVRAYLVSRASIYALVGARVYCTHRDQGRSAKSDGQLPALTIHRISGGHEHDLDGSAGNAMPRIQVSCWADDDDECDELAEAVRNVMQGFGGGPGGGLMGTVPVGVVILDNEIDLPEPPATAGAKPIYHIAQDYMIRHHEPKPTFV